MDIIVWIVTGGIVGWLAHSLAGLTAAGAPPVSMLIGAVGAVVGGTALAPLFIVAPLETVSVTSFAFAVVASAALLVVGNLVYRLWNV
ncbi:MAG: hypothetical protein ACT4P3_14325 [Betaproteobacteria bacterium]